MRLRALGPDFDPAVVERIDAALASIVATQDVRILLAVESGSRAWGFPSPDSDYDCRFLYIRGPDDYLSLFPKRDVIEWPRDPVLDINGWDLAKALRLMLKGNAVVFEWLTSPFRYDGDARFRDECLALGHAIARPAAAAWHYLHLGQRQRRTAFADSRAVALKKVFYALRPAMALRWLRRHPGMAIPPMHFPTLLREADVPLDVRTVIEDLLERKAITRELGVGPLPAPIGALIDREFALAESHWAYGDRHPGEETQKRVDEFFRRWLAASIGDQAAPSAMIPAP